jgi:hypothetical protein
MIENYVIPAVGARWLQAAFMHQLPTSNPMWNFGRAS